MFFGINTFAAIDVSSVVAFLRHLTAEDFGYVRIVRVKQAATTYDNARQVIAYVANATGINP